MSCSIGLASDFFIGVGLHGNLRASWQNQSELGLMGTKREVSGVSETRKRNGVRDLSFIYFNPSLSVVSPALAPIKTAFGMTYDYDSAETVTRNDVETTTARGMAQNMYLGLGYSFLSMGIPAQFDIDHESPMKGQNQTVAVTKTTATIKAYAKF